MINNDNKVKISANTVGLKVDAVEGKIEMFLNPDELAYFKTLSNDLQKKYIMNGQTSYLHITDYSLVEYDDVEDVEIEE